MGQAVFFRFNFNDTPFQIDTVPKRSTLSSDLAMADWHFTEWMVITCLSKALNLAFDWATFSKTDQISFEVIWSFLLKLIPILCPAH